MSREQTSVESYFAKKKRKGPVMRRKKSLRLLGKKEAKCREK